jgi:seryl-tRNA(Sec) selenium transferase
MKAITVQAGPEQSILIEVADEPQIIEAARVGGEAAGGVTPEKLLAKLDEVAETIGETCKALHNKVKKNLAGTFPKEMSIEFGVTLAGEAGVPLVTKGSVEAAFKITATWSFNEKPASTPS